MLAPKPHSPPRIRPLPDERPRQSVANLIGRFETQSKRQPTGSSSPRSSSVVSHITGDSAKEELKEKREWPPKSVTESPDAPSEPSPSFRFKSPLLQPIQPEPQPVMTEPLPASPPDTTANGTSESKVPEIPLVPAPPKPEPETKETVVSPKPSTMKARTVPKSAQTPRPSPSTAQKVAARTTPSSSKTPTKTPSSSPLNQPRKPPPTSQPVPAVKKAPSKPASIAAAAAQRPKTPVRTATLSPKSSNLYAPTAASLARARGAPSPVPSPAKKVSGGALERLSKPTASSLSRARSPASSPVVKPAAAPRTSNAPRPSRGAPASAKGGKTPATPSKTRRIKETSPSRAPEEEAGQVAVIISATASNGTEEDVFASGSKEVSQPSPPEPEPEVEVAADDHQDDGSHLIEPTESEDKPVEPEERPADDEEIASLQPEAEQGRHLKREETASETTLAAEDPDHGEAAKDPISDKLTALASKHDGTDIEQIVNLLETVPSSRPVSIATPPSDMQEIPDEDH